jgi:5,10-methylenetetrahydrofolate reductase
VIATICPFENLRHAEWFANEVPTVRVPDALVERMRVAEQRGHEMDEGVAIAQELARVVRPMVHGLHVTAPSRRADVALRVLDPPVSSETVTSDAVSSGDVASGAVSPGAVA